MSASGILFASAPAALADDSGCFSGTGYYACYDYQYTAGGYADALVTFYGSSGNSTANFDNDTVYSMEAWVAIDYGNGYVTVWSTPVAPGTLGVPAGPFDDSGFLTQACFQFTSWSGAAVHCTGGV